MKHQPCHICGVAERHICTDGKDRIPLLITPTVSLRKRPPHQDHTPDRCCGEHDHHVMPHRGCVLR